MDIEYWLGSQANYELNLSIQDRVNALLSSGQYFSQQEEEDDDPLRFNLIGNVAVIDITGPLVTSDSWLNFFCGRTSYAFIHNALIEAATHSSVKAILLNIASGGGTPNGLPDISTLIRKISAAGIPVFSYTSGDMCSAALWLGASADKVYASEVATTGSIGVIAIHTEVVDALKMDGIKKTVFRAGKFKGIGNPFEKLDKEKGEIIQAGLDTLDGIFIQNISRFRRKSEEFIREYAADGREFIGQQGIEVGLVDGLSTFDDLIEQIQSNVNKRIATGRELNMAKGAKTTTLTQAARDLVAEGVSVEAALEATKDLATETPEPEVTTPEAQASSEPTTEEASTTPPEAPDTQLVSFLRSELSNKSTELVQLSTKVSEMERELNALKAVHEPLKVIAATSLSKMQIAMGATPLDLSDLPAETLLAQHAKTRDAFCKKFPVGGVAAVATEESKSGATVAPANPARLRQNKI